MSEASLWTWGSRHREPSKEITSEEHWGAIEKPLNSNELHSVPTSQSQCPIKCGEPPSHKGRAETHLLMSPGPSLSSSLSSLSSLSFPLLFSFFFPLSSPSPLSAHWYSVSGSLGWPRTHYVAKKNLEFMTLLLYLCSVWDDRCEPQC